MRAISWTHSLHELIVENRTPLERGRDPLPRVANLRRALGEAALRTCINSFGLLKYEFAQPRCGRYAGRSKVLGGGSSTSCLMREGLPSPRLQLVMLCFLFWTPPPMPGSLSTLAQSERFSK